MRWNELTMSGIEHGKRKGYQAGCRCDLCKDAEADYRRDYRQAQREKVGEFAASPVTSLALVTNDRPVASTSADAGVGAVEAAVQQEIEGLGADRAGLKQTVLALARIMDNPKAISTQPAAAAKLADMLETLRKSTDGKKSKLASVRSMTKPQVKTG